MAITRGGVRMEFFPERIGAMLNSPTGPVSRANKRAAEAVVKKAKTLIGTKYSDYGRIRREKGEGNHRDLKRSGKVEKAAGSNWRASFISDHALVHHQGHKAKIIRAKRGKTMVFQAREGGQVWAKQVKGFKGNPYLTNAARKLGIRVGRHGALASNSVLLGKLSRPTFRRFL